MISSTVGFYTSLVVMSLIDGCGNMLWRRASLLTSIPSGWFILVLHSNHTYNKPMVLCSPLKLSKLSDTNVG